MDKAKSTTSRKRKEVSEIVESCVEKKVKRTKSSTNDACVKKKPRAKATDCGKAKRSTKKQEVINEDGNEFPEDCSDFTEGNNLGLDDAVILANIEKVPQTLARSFVALLTEGCTLPFIARYRKTAVDNLMPDRLQELFDSYQNVVQLKKKVKSVLETLKKSKKLTPDIEKSILNAGNLSELDLIVSNYIIIYLHIL